MIRQRKTKTLRSNPPKRLGVAAVEFAVCLPVLIVIFLGSIECANMTYLKQTLTISSYEGVRKGIQYNATSKQVRQHCRDILNARNIKHASITISPKNVAKVKQGDEIQVTVSAPCNDNSAMPLTIFSGRTMTVSTTMVKE